MCLVLILLIAVWFGSMNVLAESPTSKEAAAAERMRNLRLIQGNDTDLSLNSNITRAEFITVMVRAFGQETTANLVKGAPTGFVDIDHNAWYAGYVLVAKNMVEQRGETLGYPGGKFKPNEQLTAAEAVAFLMKFLGIEKKPDLSWPENFVQSAVEAGLITEEDGANPRSAMNDPVNRGKAFYLMDSAFYTYQLPEGKTIYTRFVDTSIPELTVDSFSSTTYNTSITITGTYSNGAIEVSSASGHSASLNNGRYSLSVPLVVGDNRFTIIARNLAGNTKEVSVNVHRYVYVPPPPPPPSPATVTMVTYGAGDEETDIRFTFELSNVKNFYGYILGNDEPPMTPDELVTGTRHDSPLLDGFYFSETAPDGTVKIKLNNPWNNHPIHENSSFRNGIIYYIVRGYDNQLSEVYSSEFIAPYSEDDE
jgi:hypothetical protein